MWSMDEAQWWIIGVAAVVAFFLLMNNVHRRNRGIGLAIYFVVLGALVMWRSCQTSF